MAVKYKIQEATKRDNVVVMGPPLSGKTTWVNGQVDKAKTLFISTDGNALPGCQVAVVEDWADLMEAIVYGAKGGGKGTITTLVLDVLDDAVAFAEKKAQTDLGMTAGKTDSKGGYGKFQLRVGELVKESVLRPLLMSGKQIYVVMHSMENADGDHVPCFGSYSKDATDILNWVKGRSGMVVRTANYAGDFSVFIEAERVYAEPEKPAVAKRGKKEAENAAE